MDPRDGSILALGSLPSFDANVFAKPISQKTYDYLTSQATGAPLLDRATESALSDRLDVQADDRAGRAASRRDHRRARRSSTTGQLQARHAELPERQGRDATARSTCRDALQGVLGRLLLPARRAGRRSKGPIIQQWARKLGFGHRTGIDIPGEFPGLVPDRQWRDKGYADYVKCAARRSQRAARARPRRCSSAAASSGRGRPATTSTSPSARATCRPRRCSSPWPTRRWPTAARSSARTSARRSRTALGRTVAELHCQPRRHVHMDPHDRARRSSTGLHARRHRAGGTSADVFKGFPYRPVYGKTGTAERGLNPDQAWYACFVTRPGAADRGRRDDRARRLRRGNCGTRGAPDPLAVVRSQRDTTFHAGSSTSTR